MVVSIQKETLIREPKQNHAELKSMLHAAGLSSKPVAKYGALRRIDLNVASRVFTIRRRCST